MPSGSVLRLPSTIELRTKHISTAENIDKFYKMKDSGNILQAHISIIIIVAQACECLREAFPAQMSTSNNARPVSVFVLVIDCNFIAFTRRGR